MELTCTFLDVKRGTTATVTCPTNLEELRSRMRLHDGQDLEYIVIDSTDHLIGEHDNLNLINQFAEMIEDVDEDLVYAVNQVFGYKAKEIVREGDDYFETCTLLSEVDSQDDLGHYYVNEIGLQNLSKDTLEQYFDYEAYGRDIDINNAGGFSSYGYLQVQ